MLRLLQNVPIWLLLVIATTLEASGDALCRRALYAHLGALRIVGFLGAAGLLFGYGVFLNLAPLDFGKVVGLYIAILFVVWQIINFVAFRSTPPLPVWVGGALIVAGGLVVSYWKPG